MAIVPMPCGCCVDHQKIRIYGGTVECPWCDAATSTGEYEDWLDCASPLLFVESRPKPIAVLDGQIVELLGHCPSGTPFVRFRGEVLEGFFTQEVIEHLEN